MGNSNQMFMYDGVWMPLERYKKLKLKEQEQIEVTKVTPKEEPVSVYSTPEDTQDDLSEEKEEVIESIKEDNIEALRAKYKAKFNKKVPPNMKNNSKWILNKINE